MSAYNEITIDLACPSCARIGQVRAQAHVAADFDGDHTGRFCGREYRIGERMAWWHEEDPRHAGWTDPDGGTPSDSVDECCYARCGACASELFALIHFLNLRPTAVLSLGLVEDWPPDYPQ